MKLWQCQNLLRAQSLSPSGLCKVTHSKRLGKEVQHHVTLSSSTKPRGVELRVGAARGSREGKAPLKGG